VDDLADTADADLGILETSYRLAGLGEIVEHMTKPWVIAHRDDVPLDVEKREAGVDD